MDKERKKGIQIHRSIVYGSHARLLTSEEKASGLHDPSHTHKWTVFLTSATTPPPTYTPPTAAPSGRSKGKGKSRITSHAEGVLGLNGQQVVPEDIDFITGGADDLGWLIKRVAFKLHETYANFNRNIDKPPFVVSETGWGEFSIQIRVQFQPETAEKTLTLSHGLKLHHWGPVVVSRAVGLGAGSGSGSGSGPGGLVGGGTEGADGEGLQMKKEDGDGRVLGDATMDASAEAATAGPDEAPPAPTLIIDIDAATAGLGPSPSVDPEPKSSQLSSEMTPTPAADADESALTAVPDGDEGEESGGDVKMEGDIDGDKTEATTGKPPAAEGGGTEDEDDEDADAEGEDDEDDDDDDDAEGEIDSAGNPSRTSLNGEANKMDVDDPAPNTNHIDSASTPPPPTASSTSSTHPTTQVNPLPVHSWQYDEIVFSDPTPQFYELLLAHEPTRLPLRSARKPDDQGAGALIGQDRGSAGVPLEFTLELERAEGNKLDEARRKVVEETNLWRQRIIDLEKEQIILKEQVAGY